MEIKFDDKKLEQVQAHHFTLPGRKAKKRFAAGAAYSAGNF
jgi:hypothetical protein